MEFGMQGMIVNGTIKSPTIQCLVKTIKENIWRRIFLAIPKKVSRSDLNWFYTLCVVVFVVVF